MDVNHVMIRYMGLDLGERRIGVAISDPMGWTAQGIEIIDQREISWKNRMDQLVLKYDIGAIVIGLPKNMDGSLGIKAQHSLNWGQELEKRYSFPIHFWDERLSSMAVERTLISAQVSRKKRKKVRDQMAASWILQGFLDAQRR